jgi:hypothetical protein
VYFAAQTDVYLIFGIVVLQEKGDDVKKQKKEENGEEDEVEDEEDVEGEEEEEEEEIPEGEGKHQMCVQANLK